MLFLFLLLLLLPPLLLLLLLSLLLLVRWRSLASDDEFAAVPAYCLRSRSSVITSGGDDDPAVLVVPEELVNGVWARGGTMGGRGTGRFLSLNGLEPPSGACGFLGGKGSSGKVPRYSSSLSSSEPASEDRLGRRSGLFGAVSTVGGL